MDDTCMVPLKAIDGLRREWPRETIDLQLCFASREMGIEQALNLQHILTTVDATSANRAPDDIHGALPVLLDLAVIVGQRGDHRRILGIALS